MKKNFATFVLSLGCAAIAFAQPAPAQTASTATPPASAPSGVNASLPTKVAVINVQQAIYNTKEGSGAAAAVTAKFQPKKDDFEKRQRDMQQISDQLKKGSATMSDDAKQKLERDLDAKSKSLQRDTQEVSDDYEQEMGKIFQEIGNKMLKSAIEPYCYQNGYAVVIDVSNQQTPVIWMAPSADITADIIKLYDQAHPAMGAPAAKPAGPVKPPTPTTIRK